MISVKTSFKNLFTWLKYKILSSYPENRILFYKWSRSDCGSFGEFRFYMVYELPIKENLTLWEDKEYSWIGMRLDSRNGKVYFSDGSNSKFRSAEDIVLDRIYKNIDSNHLEKYFPESDIDLLKSYGDIEDTNTYKDLVNRFKDIQKNVDVDCHLEKHQYVKQKDRYILPILRVDFKYLMIRYYQMDTDNYLSQGSKGNARIDSFGRISKNYIRIPSRLVRVDFNHPYIIKERW